jgi:hypothetical protein
MIPGAADRSLLNQATRASEDSLVERAMLEDKIKATGTFVCIQLLNLSRRLTPVSRLGGDERGHTGTGRSRVLLAVAA